MKIISLSIDNFGKLNNYSNQFSEGVNMISAANGFGKTTLCAFVFAMFYGFEDEFTAKYRERYAPWQGGVYGGTISFEAAGKEYVLTRTFGTKHAKDDTFQLKNADGEISNDYDEYIGEQLFGLSAESFANTVFTGASGPIFSSTENIALKVNANVLKEEEKTSYEQAQEMLAKYLENNSVANKSGRVSELVNELDYLRDGTGIVEQLELEIKDEEEHLSKKKETLEKIKEDYELWNLRLLNCARAKEGRLILEKEKNLTRMMANCEDNAEKLEKPSFVGGILLILLGILMMLLGVLAYIFDMPLPVYAVFEAFGLMFVIVGNVKNAKARKAYSKKRDDLEGKITESRKKLEDFILTNNIGFAKESVAADGADMNAEEITIQQNLLVTQRSDVEAEIRALELDLEKLRKEKDNSTPSAEHIREVENEISRELHDIELVEQTAELLKEAREKYSQKYIEPINKSFRKYYRLFTGLDADKCVIDADLKLMISEYDELRSEELFSAGYRDVFGLCMRLAMLDSLFKKEMPFIMLDDPFVNLDSSKKEKAIITIQRLPYQVIITQKF